jgi:hypothetical protein
MRVLRAAGYLAMDGQIVDPPEARLRGDRPRATSAANRSRSDRQGQQYLTAILLFRQRSKTVLRGVLVRGVRGAGDDEHDSHGALARRSARPSRWRSENCHGHIDAVALWRARRYGEGNSPLVRPMT